jgi:hypothetical protein
MATREDERSTIRQLERQHLGASRAAVSSSRMSGSVN